MAVNYEVLRQLHFKSKKKLSDFYQKSLSSVYFGDANLINTAV